MRLIKLSTQYLLIGFLPRSLSSLSAISRTRGFVGGIPRKDALSIHYLITSSSRFIRRFKFSSQSLCGRVLARQLRTII
jgi:hypothetical protein